MTRAQFIRFEKIDKLGIRKEPFIEDGYRIRMNLIESLASSFYLHNQTINIWSCFLPFLITVYLLVQTLSSSALTSFTGDETLITADDQTNFKIVFSIYLSCLGIAFLVSALFHALECCDLQVRKWLAIYDYIGIYLIGAGSCLPGIYYGFSSYPSRRNLYLCGNVINAVIGIALSHWEPFQVNKRLRVISVSVAASFGVVFSCDLGMLLPFEEHSKILFPICSYYVLMGIGLFFYVSRIPERWFPGQFNIWFHSHQFWHLFATLGIFVLYNGWIDFVHWKMIKGAL